MTTYPKIFEVAESAAQLIVKVKDTVQNPMAMYELTEGEFRDLTFATSLPNEPLRLFFQHAMEVLSGYYYPELKGALASASQWAFSKFHDTERVKRRFLNDFVAAYDSMVFNPVAASAVAVAAQAKQEDEDKKPADQEQKGHTKEGKAAMREEFRIDAEANVTRQLEARIVSLTQEGDHNEVSSAVSSCRLYQNLTETVKFMAFYDVKNAKLLDRRVNETLVQREPLLDMPKFTAFCDVANGLLKSGDVVWILCGKSDASVQKIRKKVVEIGWKCKSVHLIYDWKCVQKFYVKYMRGMANSKTYEQAILCWKGRFPAGLPKDRAYVDAGSHLYVDTMTRVPVLHPKDLAFVEAPVLNESLRTMCGLAEEPPPDEPAESDEKVADSAAQMRPLQDHVKKRRLYRATTDSVCAWFPHDNHPDLLKELVWESGTPRWVLYGTPASGAGVLGCLEMGVSVITLCEDAHHLDHFMKALKQRAVEAMLAGSRIFKDDVLKARALEFCSVKKEPKQEEKTEKDKKDNGSTDGSTDDGHKKAKKDKKKKKKAKDDDKKKDKDKTPNKKDLVKKKTKKPDGSGSSASTVSSDPPSLASS